jgi:D-alanyl-D-alanine carboxypeptidase
MALRGFRSRIFRLVQITAGACVTLSAIAMCAAPAEARAWRHYHRHVHYAARFHGNYGGRRLAAPANPAFAAIVVDANTGRTLYAVNENELRHPASITKVMTLYLLFEQLDKGALTLQSPIPISEHAAAQEPSKLGLEPGQTISVENAIKAIVTRSANDIAVAVAEKIGGDESTFAAMMTRKAHALGMSRTFYVNASGLPNDGQLTTARDLTILGRATEERFPRYFKYFSTHEFEYGGEIIGNHDHLLGRVDGVDGIKTGYTRASGFNLLTSVHRDGRSLIAVVMGGRTARSRDDVMASLIADHIAEASNRGHTATMIADSEAAEPVAARIPPAQPVAAASPARSFPALVAAETAPPLARPVAAQVDEGDAEDEEDEAPHVAAVLPPTQVAQRLSSAAARTPEPVRPEPVHAATVRPQPARPEPVRAESVRPEPARPERVAEATPAELGWVKGPDPVSLAKLQAAFRAEPAARPIVSPTPHPPVARAKEETEVARREEPRANEGPRAGDRNGWIVQIGATDDANKANELLTRARAKSRAALASAKPLTEKVKKGDDVFYRARFAGLDSASADAACRSLKRSGFSCFAARD